MLSILHIYQSPSFSGAEGYALEFAINQAKTFDVSFLVKPLAPLEEKVRSSNAKIKTITTLKSVDIADFDIVILHSTQELKHHWPKIAFAKLKSKLAGKRLTKVVLYTHIWISHSKRDLLHAIPYAFVDRVWTASMQARQSLERFLPVRRELIEVVRYGRDTIKFQNELLSQTEARKILNLPHEALVVGTIARVDRGKGSHELFEAVTALMQTWPNLHLLMIGPPTNGDARATELDRQIDQSIENLSASIRERIHKMGRVENATTLMSAFDLFILATYKENFALTLLEALLAQVPCIATNSGGSPDVVHPLATGWLCLPESVESLRETLLLALQQKERWKEFGLAGRNLVEKNYDFTQIMKNIDNDLLRLR